MKIILFICLCIFFHKTLLAQNTLTDSLIRSLLVEKTDTGEAKILNELSTEYQRYKPDTAFFLAQKAYLISHKNHFLKGESGALGKMSSAFSQMGNNSKALEYILEQLKIEEKRNLPDNLANVYLNIAYVYINENDFDNALLFALKSDSIIKAQNITYLILYSKINIGDIYEKQNNLNKALEYTSLCYQLAIKAQNDLMIGTALNNLGNIYSKKNEPEQASNFYNNSVPFLKKAGDYNTLVECNLNIAKLFEKNEQYDSAKYFGLQSFQMAMKNGFLNQTLATSDFLYRLYKKINNHDSAFAYLEKMISLKDSVENKEKIRKVQEITMEEQLRQKEMAYEKERDMEDTKEKLQLLAIGIFIPIFFFLSIYLSRKKIHKRIIEISGIISLLLFFEYITLLIHPYVANKTHHSPVLEIIIFVTIAAIITPTHHRIEHWLIKKMGHLNELSQIKYKKQAVPIPIIADKTVTKLPNEEDIDKSITPIMKANVENTKPPIKN